jgi:hypothetical protein
MESECNDNLFERFFNQLEILSQKYEEFMDTEVRDALHITINHYFIWEKKYNSLPVSYGMYSLEADRDVTQVVAKFIIAANNFAKANSVPLGQARLDLLQNPNTRTSCGHRYYEFIGHVDKPLSPEPLPRFLFEEGEYDLCAENE